jgi:N-acetylneuraminic acid mutarotase
MNGREQLFFFGGKVKTTGAALADYLKEVQRYDPVSGRWTTVSAMPHPAVQAGSIELGPSSLAIIGGSDGHDLDRVAELGERYRLPDRIMIYDATSDRWRAGGRMPLGVAAPAVIKLGQDWLVAGGEYSPGLRTAEIYRAKVVTAAVTE